MKRISKKKELMDRLIKEDVVKAVLTLIKQDLPVTMDEVALQCGVAKGTLYNYFKNKKDLISYVHQNIILPIKKNAAQIFESPVSAREKIHTFVDRVFGFEKEYPLYFKFIQSQRTASEALDERMTLTILPLVKICREGVAAGDFMEVDPYAMAGMIFGSVIGPMESMTYRETPVQDLDALKKDVLCLLDRVLLKKQERLS
jgi:AcrR family transcriptional regulator